MKDLDYLSEYAIKAAKIAGDHLLSATANEPFNIKKDHHSGLDYATETDIQCENMIRDILKHTNIPVYGEELLGADPSTNISWIVDPLDGTLNWANNIPIYAVSIALAEYGNPLLGVIYIPSLAKMYHGSVSQKATCNNSPIEVTSAPLLESVIACDLHITSNDPLIYKIKNQAARVRLLGSSAYELALAAEGSLAAVISPYAKFHDIAAGIAIINASSGVALSIDGTNYKPASGSVIAGSKESVYQLIKAINS